MLTGKQKRYLRALANRLRPITQVGKDGFSVNLCKSISDAFHTHELIKINMLKTCSEDINDLGMKIADACDCELVQIIGKTLVFYKRAEEPQIMLP